MVDPIGPFMLGVLVGMFGLGPITLFVVVECWWAFNAWLTRRQFDEVGQWKGHPNVRKPPTGPV